MGGDDALSGGLGTDTVSYAAAGSGVTASFANASINTGEAAGDTYDQVENLTGSAFDDYVYGNSGNNVIDGGAGNDILKGYAGNDHLIGNSGDDVLCDRQKTICPAPLPFAKVRPSLTL